jgi:hypothetical protein
VQPLRDESSAEIMRCISAEVAHLPSGRRGRSMSDALFSPGCHGCWDQAEDAAYDGHPAERRSTGPGHGFARCRLG